MKTVISAVISTITLMLLLGCAQPSVHAEKKTVTANCTDPRPMICTMDYTPVCGLRGEEWKTYSNACSACSDPEVQGYLPGECTAEE